MLDWKQKAKATFPELDSAIDDADSPYMLWIELRQAFERAYEQKPRDESLIQRIYQYSDWCADQPEGKTASDDLFTCVAVCFYEHIPEHPAAREDMPRWWRAEDLDPEPSIFSHHLSGKEFFELRRYLAREKHRYDPKLRLVTSNSP
jgi:hypothetical protein